MHLSNQTRAKADSGVDKPVEAVDSAKYALPLQIGMTLTEVCPWDGERGK